MAERVSAVATEVVYTEDDHPIRASALAVEVIHTLDAHPVRLGALVMEVIWIPDTAAAVPPFIIVPGAV